MLKDDSSQPEVDCKDEGKSLDEDFKKVDFKSLLSWK